MNTISANDREIIRNLAKKQSELATTPEMDALRTLWTDHNDCKPSRPMMTVELGTFEPDIIPQLLKCEGDSAREIEAMFHRNLVNHEIFKDDTIVNNFIGITAPTWFKPFDIEVRVEHSEGLGHHFVSQIDDLDEDFHLFKPSTFGVNREAWNGKIDLLTDLFGDILPVKPIGGGLYSVPTQNIVHLMSMETMLFSMYDYPEKFKEMMDILSNDYLRFFQFLQDEKLLRPTIGSEGVGQGTYAFTRELPGDDEFKKRIFTAKDVWGFMDSQETSGISPEMFEEFIFPYYKKVADCYGLMSYGCCEATDPIWDSCLSKLDNLRKVSISPWCNEEFMGEKLSKKKVIFHRKPSPNFLGVGSVLDEDGLRAHFAKTLKAAKGCTVEFTQRDVYELHNTPQKVTRYVEILREECEKF